MACFDLDLNDLHSVNKFADDFLANKCGQSPLHVLICNAGIMHVRYNEPIYSKQGYEQHFAVNHLAHYLLIKRLTPLLNRAHDETKVPARIINVASDAYTFVKAVPQDWSESLVNQDLTARFKKGSFEYYGFSKLCNVWCAAEINREQKALPERKIIAFSLHPGLVSTNLARDMGAVATVMLFLLRAYKTINPHATWGAITPREGAKTTMHCVNVKLAQVDDVEYYSQTVPGAKALRLKRTARDENASKKLVELSEALLNRL